MEELLKNYGGCVIAIIAAWIVLALFITQHKQDNADETVKSENVIEPNTETELQSQPVFVYESDNIVVLVLVLHRFTD